MMTRLAANMVRSMVKETTGSSQSEDKMEGSHQELTGESSKKVVPNHLAMAKTTGMVNRMSQ